MSQVDPRVLDYSNEMRGYFQEVAGILVRSHRKSPDEASDLVNLYFALDVDPLERALVMHTAAEDVAADLATMAQPDRCSEEICDRRAPSAAGQSWLESPKS